jgi:hypothetical protein
MRLAKILFFTAIAVACASGAHAALVFNADFAQDGRYEVTWPMKPGEVVVVDIYVSNVPAPGLIAMGFKLTYDPMLLAIDSADANIANWPSPPQGPHVDMSVSGEIDIAGYRLQGLAGDNIPLCTVTLRCIAEGSSEFRLTRRGDDVDGFVLDCIQPCDPNDPALRLDTDIGAGKLLANILPVTPGDTNGDGTVGLADAILVLQMLAKLNQGYLHANADMNNDSVIGLQEVFFILQKVAAVR